MNAPRTGSSKYLMLFLAVLIGFLAVLPWTIRSEYVRHLIIVAMMFAIVASNWDLSLGYAGIFNFAHIALFAVGAYTAGVLSKTFGVSPWLCIPAGALASVLLAVAVALPVLRVKGIYVCLVTFAFGQLCLHLILSMSSYTGGSNGLVMIPSMSLGSYSFAEHGKIGYYYLVLSTLIASTVFLRRLVRSYFGLSIVALRDFEDLAISRGVSVARQRLLTLAASAVFTGAIGAIYAFYLGAVSAELFGFGYLATILSMILLGGTSTIYGSLAGAFVLTFISEFLVSLGPWRFVMISAMIIVIIWRYPSGLLLGLRSVVAGFSKSERAVVQAE